VQCPAYRQIQNHCPGGVVTANRGFVPARRDEIEGLNRNVEKRENAEHALKQIIDIEEGAVCGSPSSRVQLVRPFLTGTTARSRSPSCRMRIGFACNGSSPEPRLFVRTSIYAEESSMITSYNPRISRELAEKADGSHASTQAREAAYSDFEGYHRTKRMLRLASEVELLRELVEQARRIRYSPEVCYIEVRDLFEAIRTMPPDPCSGTPRFGLAPYLLSTGTIE
jgi:hypothetical protein